MKAHSNSKGIERREFLRAVGLASGALAVHPLSSAASTLAEKRITGRTKKTCVGLLLPASKQLDDSVAQFRKGFDLMFEANPAIGDQLRLSTHEVTDGLTGARRGLQKLIEQNKCKVIVSLLNPAVADALAPSLELHKTPLISVSAGERISKTHSPYLLHHTLGYWQSSYAAGAYAAQHVGKRAAIVCTMHECGYDGVAMFRAGFESSGGEVVDFSIADSPAILLDHYSSFEKAVNSQPDLIYVAGSGESGVALLHSAHSKVPNSIKLLFSQWISESKVHGLESSEAHPLYACQPWSESLNNPENQKFVLAYKEVNGKTPGAFAVLGFETAHILFHLADARNVSLDAFKKANFVTPRGGLRYSEELGGFEGPLHITKLKLSGGAIKSEMHSENFISHPTTYLERALEGGWTNAYLPI